MSIHPNRGFAVGAALFLFVWVVLSSPWLSGRVTIPYDAKAHFQAQIQFLANALHSGQSPAWSPNIFTGSPQIADPQSMIFSPVYLIAALSPQPSFQLVDGFVLALLALGGIAVLALFRDRGWHPAGAVLAALCICIRGIRVLAPPAHRPSAELRDVCSRPVGAVTCA